jgi:hypothetical protein
MGFLEPFDSRGPVTTVDHAPGSIMFPGLVQLFPNQSSLRCAPIIRIGKNITNRLGSPIQNQHTAGEGIASYGFHL